MDERFLPYFEDVQDGGPQSTFLREFGPEEVQNGICLHLSIAWLYFYKADCSKKPNLVFRGMRQAPIIQQIANNQRGYQMHNLSVRDCIKPYGLSIVNMDSATNTNDLPVVMKYLAYNQYLITFYLHQDNILVGGHAVALIRHTDGRSYLYDPNIGVLSAPTTNETEILNLLRLYYEIDRKYVIRNGNIYEFSF